MYERGYGMEVDMDKAIELYEKSAEYGLEEAKERLNDIRNIVKVNK